MFRLINAFFDRFGLSFLMVASYFGAGSIYIASQAGVQYGYTLIWTVVGAVLIGFMAQDMSARLGIFGGSLMAFIRQKIGKKGAIVVTALLSLGCILWAIELAAAVGMAVEMLTDGAFSWKVAALVTGLLAILVGIINYKYVELITTAMMVGLLLVYLVVAGASSPDLGELASGFIPSLPDSGAVLLGAAILGTTALWPNFFLESILVSEKGWNKRQHVKEMRVDLAVGYTVGGLITVAIIVVSAAVLRPAGFTQLESFITPGVALSEVLGQWAMIAFLIGVIAASFNSIVPIMWTVPFMLLDAIGHKDNAQSSKAFKWIYVIATSSCFLAPVLPEFLDLQVLDMIILFPAINGVFGLPLTAAFLFWAVNDKETMKAHVNNWRLNLVNILLVLFSVYIAVRSGRSVLQAILKKWM